MTHRRCCCLPYPSQRMLQGLPPLCAAPGLLSRIPFGPSPSLRSLLRPWPTTALVRKLLRYYVTVRLPVVVHHRRAPLGFMVRAAPPSTAANHGTSRLPRGVPRCAPGVLDRAGSGTHLALAVRPVLPLAQLDSGGTLKYGGQFRGSIPGSHLPLSTLHRGPYGHRRMTRGQGGSLTLPCIGLPPTAHLRLRRHTKLRPLRSQPSPGPPTQSPAILPSDPEEADHVVVQDPDPRCCYG